MLKTVQGNKIVEIEAFSLNELVKNHNKVEIDLGTGDGKLVYKLAQQQPNTLFIGIDPSHTQLEIYSKKAKKEKLTNTLFVWDSIENMGEELNNTAHKVYVYLPWGSLLKHLTKPSESMEYINKIAGLLKAEGTFEVIFGYSEEHEPTEVERLELVGISRDYLETNVIPYYKECNLKLESLEEIYKEDLANLNTSWGKKLSFGQTREMFKVVFKKI